MNLDEWFRSRTGSCHWPTGSAACNAEPIAAGKKTARGRKQDRARVAKAQDYEVRYEAKKTGRSASVVKKAAKKVGSSRKRVEKRLSRWRKDGQADS